MTRRRNRSFFSLVALVVLAPLAGVRSQAPRVAPPPADACSSPAIGSAARAPARVAAALQWGRPSSVALLVYSLAAAAASRRPRRAAAIARSTRPRDRALAEDDRLVPGQVEHRRRRARQLARVDDRGHALADLLGHVLERRGSGPPWRFALVARRRRPARPRRGRGRQVGHADADRVRPLAREPAEAPGRVRENERVRPGRSARAQRRAAASSGRRRGRRPGQPASSAIGIALGPLSRVRARDRRPPVGVGAEPVDGVGRQDDGLAALERRDAASTSHRPRPSTTRSTPGEVAASSGRPRSRGARARGHVRALPSPHSRTRRRPAGARAARLAIASPRPRRRAPPAAPSRGPRARGSRAPPAARRAGSRRRGRTAREAVQEVGLATARPGRRAWSARGSRGNGERVRESVDADHPRARMLVGERERDRPEPVPTSTTRGASSRG